MTAFPVLLNYEPAHYLLEESFQAENKEKARISEETVTYFVERAFVGNKISYAPNVRTIKNGDVDGIFFDIPVEDKKWKADELVEEVLSKGGTVALVSIKNWRNWAFSIENFKNLMKEMQNGDPKHKATWFLIISKLKTTRRIKHLLANNKINVIETGMQITLDETQSHLAQVQWLNTLHEKLKPQLYKIFGLLLYRVYNYTTYRNLKNISNLSYLQSLKLLYSEKIKFAYLSL